MRKLAAIGALAAGFLGTVSGAGAAQVATPVSGTLANNTNTCFNIVAGFIFSDCSYANTRFPGANSVAASTPTWIGPVFATGFYAKGSTADGVPGLTYAIYPNDGKLAVPLTGTVTVDDNGTPANGADDTISAEWSFGEAVHNASTGQGDRAVETWDSFDHVMAATPVNFATANGDGGFDYVIGARGRPTPVPGPLAGAGPASPKCLPVTPGDIVGLPNTGTFPSETACNLDVNGTPLSWVSTGASDLPAAERIGIERSPGFGMVDDTQDAPNGTLSPNAGGQTTATFSNYTCLDTIANSDNDCSTSEILFGTANVNLLNEDGTTVVGDGTPNQVGGNCTDGVDNDGTDGADAADPQCAVRTGPPGFENVVLILGTDDTGAVTSAEAYWTREYVVRNGPQIGNNLLTNSTRYTTPNSWTGGRFTFVGLSTDPAVANDDTFNNVPEGSVDFSLPVFTNDVPSAEAPNTVVIVTAPPANEGTATVSNNAILFTPRAEPGSYFFGTTTLTYKVVDGLARDSNPATVIINVAKKVPNAINQSGTSNNGASVSKVVLAATNQGSGPIASHEITTSNEQLGTCSVGVDGVTLTFTPSGGNGTGGCSFTITDDDGDTDTAQFSVDVLGSSSGGGGSSGPQLPGGGSLDSLALAALLAGIPLVARRRRRAT